MIKTEVAYKIKCTNTFATKDLDAFIFYVTKV